jgi:hypothetical protein
MRCTLNRSASISGLFLILFVAIAAALASGCAQRMEKLSKNMESSNEGLNRTISLYDLEGDLVSRWNAKTYVETRREGIISFLDSAGHEVKLVGGIVVVQEN